MIKDIIILILLIVSIYYYRYSDSLELNNKSLELRLYQLEHKETNKVEYIPIENGEILN